MACLRAGAPLAKALRDVSMALGSDPSASVLHQAAEALSLGTSGHTSLSALPLGLHPLRDAAVLSERTGADLADLLTAAAHDDRRSRARRAEARAATLAVRLVLPTGLCILPAFVVLGIVPTVYSLLTAPGLLSP
ncbi:type II secretion system F family protein [Devriesea agamarum]|uniref:type II secretion system F family protein n=1 Tax=Devriesea agamarum TaxID=472569 RepID=UPI00155E34D0|nr:type II secretion system F family protein [Devriesea agamarum]